MYPKRLLGDNQPSELRPCAKVVQRAESVRERHPLFRLQDIRGREIDNVGHIDIEINDERELIPTVAENTWPASGPTPL
jgi:hypothetical protein